MNSCSVTISYSFDFEVQLRIQVFGSSHKEAPGLTFCETPKQEFSGADTNLQFSEGNFDIRCCKTAQSASPDIIFFRHLLKSRMKRSFQQTSFS